MIKEEGIELTENPQEFLNMLFKDGSIDDSDGRDFKINYFGEKSESYFDSLSKNFPIEENDETKINELFSHLSDADDTRNFNLYIKYKDIYIGGLSILDFKSRVDFGLNKYLDRSEPSFYYGQWEHNRKSGIGFLKIDNNNFYIGNFSNNQMNGEGLYYNKSNSNYYLGDFKNGKFKKGIYWNLENDLYYIGEFVNNKKNDNFCCYYNQKKNSIFLGKIKNDEFIKGYIAFINIKEMDNSEEVDFTIENTYTYNKSKKDSPAEIHSVKKDDNNIFNEILPNIYQALDTLKSSTEEINELFEEKENIYNDNVYSTRIGRYNSYNNKFSFENEFIEDYNNYFENLNQIKEILDMKEIQKKLMN